MVACRTPVWTGLNCLLAWEFSHTSCFRAPFLVSSFLVPNVTFRYLKPDKKNKKMKAKSKVLSSPFCLYFGLLRKKDMSWTKRFKRQNPKCWNGLNFNVGRLTLQASIKCYLAWIVKENGNEQYRLELCSCIAEMYDSVDNKWKHAYVRKYGLINKIKDMQFSMEACVKKHNTHALNVSWIAWPLLLTSLTVEVSHVLKFLIFRLNI